MPTTHCEHAVVPFGASNRGRVANTRHLRHGDMSPVAEQHCAIRIERHRAGHPAGPQRGAAQVVPRDRAGDRVEDVAQRRPRMDLIRSPIDSENSAVNVTSCSVSLIRRPHLTIRLAPSNGGPAKHTRSAASTPVKNPAPKCHRDSYSRDPDGHSNRCRPPCGGRARCAPSIMRSRRSRLRRSATAARDRPPTIVASHIHHEHPARANAWAKAITARPVTIPTAR